jgi:hypothetical protein
MPRTITVTLTQHEKDGCVKTRFQNRTLKSVRLGEITVRHEVGKTETGTNLQPHELRGFAPCRSQFSYDTILAVTELRFRRLMQRVEIQNHLALRGLYISTGSISNLSWMGLAYLEYCHFGKAKELAERYRQTCFFVHVDGTNEGGKYCHFVVRDGMSGNVLCAEKIRSESEASIVPILQKVKELFGVPEAIISDMSPAIKKAVNTVFKNVPHRLCHFHFLKDVGKDLFQDLHQCLKYSVKDLKTQLKELRAKFDVEQTEKFDCRAWLISMIDRINDYERELSGEGFPFDLAYLAFYERCLDVYNATEGILNEIYSSGRTTFEPGIGKNLCFLRNTLQKFLERLKFSVGQLKKVNAIFLELRDILHPKTDSDRIPMNWGMLNHDSKLENMEMKISELEKTAEKKVKATYLAKYEWKAWNVVYKHLKKYGTQLNPEITVNGQKILLPRTNNLSETGFREIKRKARRTTGKKNLSRYMDHLPAQYSYVANLDDPGYVEVVFGDKEIHDSFHQVNQKQIRQTTDRMKAQRRSPTAIDIKLIRDDGYLNLLVEHFIRNTRRKAATRTLL